jgi:ribonucleotide reductase alpha subunit
MSEDIAPFATNFAYNVYKGKYARDGETWADTADRVVDNVMAALPVEFPDATEAIRKLIYDRKFIPGGRYLYAAGNDYHQVQNCLLLRAEDSREGWAELSYKAAMSLMTGAGIGVYYGDVRPGGSIIRRTGGVATGPIPLMEAINEQARAYVQGGNRRSAIWAGLPWDHPDCEKFIRAKDWPEWLRKQKEIDFSTPAPLDMTNISVCLNDEFFEAYEDINHPKHELAHRIYHKTVDKMVTTGEPGFSIDLGDKSRENLRNAPVLGHTRILTSTGYKKVSEIIDRPVTVWTGKQWAQDVKFTETGRVSEYRKITMTGGREIECDPTHPFIVNGERIPAEDLKVGQQLDVGLPTINESQGLDADAYTLGWLYGDGSFTGKRAELTLCSDESKACRRWLAEPSSENVCDGRGYHRMYWGGNNDFSGHSKERLHPSVFQLEVDEIASFIAGLFDADGNFEPLQQRIRLASKHRLFLVDIQRLLEQLGIIAHVSKAGTSTYGKAQGYQLVVASGYHDLFVDYIPCKRLQLKHRTAAPYRESKIKVLSNQLVRTAGEEVPVYCADVKVEEHSFVAEGVVISNCTEIVSEDDSDICNLGGLVLSRFDSPEEFGEAVKLGVLFLTAGTLYSDLPYDKVHEVRDKNRRLGLDILGVHDFLLQRGLRYGTDEAFEALQPYMEEYSRALDYAHEWQDQIGISRSVAATSGAPTGTRGIIAETTTGWEPVTAVAYKRRVRHSGPDGDRVTYEYVVDPTIKRLAEQGLIDPEQPLDDAYSLAYDVERRFRMQAFAQSYTDQAISMTINLPYPITDKEEQQDFADLLYKYLPKLRGITCYPNNARGGQPIVPVPLSEALGQEGVVYEEDEEKCASGVCGI